MTNIYKTTLKQTTARTQKPEARTLSATVFFDKLRQIDTPADNGRILYMTIVYRLKKRINTHFAAAGRMAVD